MGAMLLSTVTTAAHIGTDTLAVSNAANSFSKSSQSYFFLLSPVRVLWRKTPIHNDTYYLTLTLTLTTALTLLTIMVTVSGNSNPTNPTTQYRCEYDNLNCIFAVQETSQNDFAQTLTVQSAQVLLTVLPSLRHHTYTKTHPSTYAYSSCPYDLLGKNWRLWTSMDEIGVSEGIGELKK